jgi:cysteine desulfurase
MDVRSSDIIYWDNNATTRIDPSVFEVMVPYLTEYFGNPSSAYRFGAQVAGALKQAREQVAALLGCEPREIYFTSCGTESDNTAIASALQTTGKRHVIVSQVEHSAVKKQAEYLERSGYAVTWLPVCGDGTLDLQVLEKAIRPDTAIVSLMWANNETGVLFPVMEAGALCRSKGVLFHTDAVQVPGKLPIQLRDAPIDFLSVSGHKLHAPKGVGVLYARRRVPFQPHLIGGGQEKGKRGGTENVASIVGLGRAAELALAHIDEEQTRVRALRDRFENGVLERVPGTRVNGHRTERLPNTSNLCFPGLEAEAILLALDRHGICVSAGSACTTGALEPSHVLRAMGISPEDAIGSLRFSLCRHNTDAEVDRVLEILPTVVRELHAALPAVAGAA